MKKAVNENNSHQQSCTLSLGDNFRRWLPKNVPGAFKVLLCSLLLINSIILSACGNRRPQDTDSVFTNIAEEKRRLESLLLGGKQEIQNAQIEIAIARDMDHLIVKGNEYNPIMIEDVLTYEPQTSIYAKDHLLDLKKNYPFMVARMGLDRGVQTLMQWIAVNKESTLKLTLNQQVPLEVANGHRIEVRDPLTGESTSYINPWRVIRAKYPALKDRIDQMDTNLPRIPLKQIKSTMIEAFLSVGPQIAEVQFAINNKVSEIHKSLKNTEIYMKEYQELFLERQDLVGVEYARLEKEREIYLIEDKQLEANRVLGKMNLIYNKFSDEKKSRFQALDKELGRLKKLRVDPSKKELDKLKQELMSLQMLVSNMLKAEPILTALTLTNEFINDEGIKKQVPLFLILHDMVRQGEGELDTRLKKAAKYVDDFLTENQEKMRKRVLSSIALLASGDRKYIAPLSSLRQTTLAFLQYRYPGLAKDKTFKDIDDKISDEFGFDIYGERFADFTFGNELGMILLTSMTTGLYSNEIRHMKPYKKSVVNWMKSSPGKTGFVPAVRNRMGESLRKTISGISEYEAYRNEVFDDNVRFKEEMKAKWKAGELKEIKLGRPISYPVNKIKNYGKLLKRATFRMFPSGLLYGSLADVGLMVHFANKNKQYFINSKYVIQNGVYAGILPYTSGVFAHQEPEGMLKMRLIFMTVSALVLNYYFAWNAGFSFTKAVVKAKKAKRFVKGKNLNEASLWLFARSIKNSAKRNWKAVKVAFENNESVGKGIFNAATSGLLVTFGEMLLRGFDDKLIPYDDLFTIDYWSRVIAMYTEEGSLAFLNLLSFMVIDFILIFAFDNSKLMSNSKMKIYMAGFLGVLVAMWAENLIRDGDMTTLNHQRLIFEGSYLATVSTYKYAFLFGPLYDGLERLFYKKGWLLQDRKMGIGRTAIWNVTKALFFMTNNLAGNLPFQFIIYMEESSDVGPLEAQADLHSKGIQIVKDAQRNMSVSGSIELSEKELGYITANMSNFNDKLQNWLKDKKTDQCSTPDGKFEIFGPYTDVLSSVCPQN